MLWHALLGAFVLSTICFILLQYFASKLRSTSQNMWLQNCKSATWQIAQIWLLQGEFYPTRLTSYGPSFFLSIFSMASVTQHKKTSVKIKFKTNSNISRTDYIKNKQTTSWFCLLMIWQNSLLVLWFHRLARKIWPLVGTLNHRNYNFMFCCNFCHIFWKPHSQSHR